MKKQLAQHIALLTLTIVALIIALPMVRAQGDLIPESSTVAAADTEVPSDVENVKATAGNEKVTLTWDVATDNEMVKGYKVYYGTIPVTEPGQEYDLGAIDTGNKISYDVTGLTNGTTYYFTVTAYDASANESENYSVEVSATPLFGSAENEAPKVVSAQAQDRSTVLVTFSEAVNLPVEPQTAFTIVEDGTGTPLEVLSVSMDINDESNQTVVLTTANQKADQTYIVTAGIQITDFDGSPVESGTSDTAVFTGTDVETALLAAAPEADILGPELVSINAPDVTTVVVNFNEPVVLAPDATQNFVITEEADSNKTLTVKSASLSDDGMTVTLTTDPQQAISYFLIVLDVTDSVGNLMDVANNAAAFSGYDSGEVLPPAEPEAPAEPAAPAEPSADLTAPEDVTNLVAKLLSDMIVQLNWTSSLNSAGDLANYVLYSSLDGMTYSDGVLVDTDVSSQDLSGLTAGMTHYFKLVAVDTAGNESVGAEASLYLPSTGPELLLLLGGSLGAGRFFTRRKKARGAKAGRRAIT
ncbi:fibronectin type III domain-containing protein [Patescibacteria group bacterium]|nr:fibronectin type III domain-containing protein [Patescibacteria group bacterium]MBU1703358.1 fibronectin type III domain-containing protein [Patescibacteria group bacterium]MBU1954204.1 fibronectin type III domain-containing protein [Patescibacteria group bacterium]